ncbi:MAG: succinylglutamate desuccinylase/aspartoacylase family protein, partial [Planctomycetaceae bacterium]
MHAPINLQCLRITGSRPGPHLLITGGVHGDEFESMPCIRQLAQFILPEKLQGNLTLIPVVNEAAFLNGDRVAEDGLDLARVCPGESNGSVTQRTAAALTEQIQQADYYIDLHSGGIPMEVW